MNTAFKSKEDHIPKGEGDPIRSSIIGDRDQNDVLLDTATSSVVSVEGRSVLGESLPLEVFQRTLWHAQSSQELRLSQRQEHHREEIENEFPESGLQHVPALTIGPDSQRAVIEYLQISKEDFEAGSRLALLETALDKQTKNLSERSDAQEFGARQLQSHLHELESDPRVVALMKAAGRLGTSFWLCPTIQGASTQRFFDPPHSRYSTYNLRLNSEGFFIEDHIRIHYDGDRSPPVPHEPRVQFKVQIPISNTGELIQSPSLLRKALMLFRLVPSASCIDEKDLLPLREAGLTSASINADIDAKLKWAEGMFMGH